MRWQDKTGSITLMIMASNMLQNQDIVCFALGDWWGMNPSCTTHIMKKLAVKNRVIYINPISSDLFGMSRKKQRFARIIRKLKSIIKLVRKVNHNLYVVSPVFLPLQGNQHTGRQAPRMGACLPLRDPRTGGHARQRQQDHA